MGSDYWCAYNDLMREMKREHRRTEINIRLPSILKDLKTKGYAVKVLNKYTGRISVSLGNRNIFFNVYTGEIKGHPTKRGFKNLLSVLDKLKAKQDSKDFFKKL